MPVRITVATFWPDLTCDCIVAWTQVTQLLQSYLAGYKLAPVFTEEEVAHALLPQEDVIASYVVETSGVVHPH